MSNLWTWYEDSPELIHDVPETRSDERVHVIAADCWCEPLIGDAIYATGVAGNVAMHRKAAPRA